jgi:hypothetical protein
MDAPGAVGGPLFATTHWSVVLAAGDEASPEAAAALERLCRTYWFPLYAYVRRRGYAPEDARDLTQGFFYRLLDRKWLPQAHRQKGRFRSFLLVAMNHFLATLARGSLPKFAGRASGGTSRTGAAKAPARRLHLGIKAHTGR